MYICPWSLMTRPYSSPCGFWGCVEMLMWELLILSCLNVAEMFTPMWIGLKNDLSGSVMISAFAGRSLMWHWIAVMICEPRGLVQVVLLSSLQPRPVCRWLYHIKGSCLVRSAGPDFRGNAISSVRKNDNHGPCKTAMPACIHFRLMSPLKMTF